MRSYRKFWPDDRLARLDQLKVEARKQGLSVAVIDAGTAHVPIFYIRFKRSGQVVDGFFDIGKAEQWLSAEVAA